MQIKYFLPILFIDLLRRLAKAQRDLLIREVFGYLPRARAYGYFENLAEADPGCINNQEKREVA